MPQRFSLALVALALFGCSDGGDVLHVPEQAGCDPLISEVCAYPFPSMRYLSRDNDRWSIDLSREVLPPNVSDPEKFISLMRDWDGFPSTTAFVTHLDGVIDDSNWIVQQHVSPGIWGHRPMQSAGAPPAAETSETVTAG